MYLDACRCVCMRWKDLFMEAYRRMRKGGNDCRRVEDGNGAYWRGGGGRKKRIFELLLVPFLMNRRSLILSSVQTGLEIEPMHRPICIPHYHKISTPAHCHSCSYSCGVSRHPKNLGDLMFEGITRHAEVNTHMFFCHLHAQALQERKDHKTIESLKRSDSPTCVASDVCRCIFRYLHTDIRRLTDCRISKP